MREIVVVVSGGTFRLSVDDGGGVITSDLRYSSLEEFLQATGSWSDESLDAQIGYALYLGGVRVLESFILAAAVAGIAVDQEPFLTIIQTVMDAIESNS